jgi:hypothetical protein
LADFYLFRSGPTKCRHRAHIRCYMKMPFLALMDWGRGLLRQTQYLSLVARSEQRRELAQTHEHGHERKTYLGNVAILARLNPAVCMNPFSQVLGVRPQVARREMAAPIACVCRRSFSSYVFCQLGRAITCLPCADLLQTANTDQAVTFVGHDGSFACTARTVVRYGPGHI